MDTFSSKEISYELISPPELPLTLPLFTSDEEVELLKVQPYALEDELDSPPSQESEGSNCACN